jgi:hypothetical protein
MTASEAVHKTVLNPGRKLKPSAKASHGTHQSNHALGPLQRKSCLGPDELDSPPLIFAPPNAPKLNHGHRSAGSKSNNDIPFSSLNPKMKGHWRWLPLGVRRLDIFSRASTQSKWQVEGPPSAQVAVFQEPANPRPIITYRFAKAASSKRISQILRHRLFSKLSLDLYAEGQESHRLLYEHGHLRDLSGW